MVDQTENTNYPEPENIQEDLKVSRMMARTAVEALKDKLGEDIRILDLHKVSVLADYFVIAHGSNRNHVQALLEAVEEKLEEAGYTIYDKEGMESYTWGLLDCHRIIVHVFTQEARVFYNLEKIWSQGQPVDPEEI